MTSHRTGFCPPARLPRPGGGAEPGGAHSQTLGVCEPPAPEPRSRSSERSSYLSSSGAVLGVRTHCWDRKADPRAKQRVYFGFRVWWLLGARVSILGCGRRKGGFWGDGRDGAGWAVRGDEGTRGFHPLLPLFPSPWSVDRVSASVAGCIQVISGDV